MEQVAPVILSAGSSTRIGYPKALLPLGKGTFISRILDTLARVGLLHPRIVLGRDAVRIRQGIAPGVRLLINNDPARGMFSSMKLALSDLGQDCSGCLFWPVDQPCVKEEVVRDLVRLFDDSEALIALPVYQGKRGHPAIFHRDLFHELLEAAVETGPKPIVAAHSSEIAALHCDDRAVVDDVDTPEDYFRLTAEKLEEALRRV